MKRVQLQNVRKTFGDVVVLEGFDLDIEAGSFVSLLGPSGCGKTTALRLVAGLERPDAGTIRVGDRIVSGDGQWVPPEARRIGMVFQSYAVWPHMTVLQNVAYPLRVRGMPRAEREMMAGIVLAVVGLGGLEGRRPNALSGGQQQRVALARGLVMEPDVLLLDEPLSNLDAKLRVRMRGDIRRIQQKAGFTALYVTHDEDEASEISDRIVRLDAGRIVGEA